MAESKIPFDGDSSWVTVAPYLKYKRDGRTVTVMGKSSGDKTLSKAQWVSLGTLPQEYRPSTEIPFVAMDRNNIRTMMGAVTTTGVVRLYSEVGNADYWIYEVTYVV